jgi:hypothetical protein
VTRRAARPRPTKHTGLLGVQADCMDCPWRSQERNGMGTAAVHAQTYGHTVHVEQTLGVIYNKRSTTE